MLKKLLLIILIFFSFFSYSFWAATSWSNWSNDWVSQSQMKIQQQNIYKSLSPAQKQQLQKKFPWKNIGANLNDWKSWDITKAAQQMVNQNNKSNTKVDSKNDISSTSFQITVWDISPGKKSIKWDSSKETAKKTLQTIIDNLIVAFWVLALLVMTIGWGYMIMYHWQDELLTKWKSIFTSGLIAVAVALSAWILVKLVVYLLY